MDLQEAALEEVKWAADKHKLLKLIDYNKADQIWRCSLYLLQVRVRG